MKHPSLAYGFWGSRAVCFESGVFKTCRGLQMQGFRGHRLSGLKSVGLKVEGLELGVRNLRHTSTTSGTTATTAADHNDDNHHNNDRYRDGGHWMAERATQRPSVHRKLQINKS